MQNDVFQAGFMVVNVLNQIISFLALGAYIAGLVICIQNRRLSNSMILCIVGFGAEIAVWVLNHLIGALGGVSAMGREGILLLAFLGVFVNLVNPIALGILVLGLFRVFRDVSDRLGLRRTARRRRDEDEYDDDPGDRPPRPRGSDSRDVRR